MPSQLMRRRLRVEADKDPVRDAGLSDSVQERRGPGVLDLANEHELHDMCQHATQAYGTRAPADSPACTRVGRRARRLPSLPVRMVRARVAASSTGGCSVLSPGTHCGGPLRSERACSGCIT